MLNEMFKDVPGYEGLYKVSNIGNVLSINRSVVAPRNSRRIIPNKLLKKQKIKGYLYVFLCRCGKRKQYGVHQLVASAFIGKKPEGLECCHFNGDRQDNRSENLRYDTRKNNISDNVRNRTIARGERQGLSILTESVVISIKKFISSGLSCSKIAKLLNIKISAVKDISAKRTWGWLNESYISG